MSGYLRSNSERRKPRNFTLAASLFAYLTSGRLCWIDTRQTRLVAGHSLLFTVSSLVQPSSSARQILYFGDMPVHTREWTECLFIAISHSWVGRTAFVTGHSDLIAFTQRFPFTHTCPIDRSIYFKAFTTIQTQPNPALRGGLTLFSHKSPETRLNSQHNKRLKTGSSFFRRSR